MKRPHPVHGEWELRYIDAASAREMLENRANNRRISPSRVSIYAQHMSTGTWTLTHQGICLDANGRVNDGQHRLSAVVESGVSQWFWCYRESVPHSGMPHFDKHQERSSLQSMQLAGYSVTSQLVSSARSVLADGNYASGRVEVTDETIWACIEMNRCKFMSIFRALGNATGYGGATLVAVLTRAMWHFGGVMDDDLLRFANILDHGLCDGPGESSAVRYRDWSHAKTLGGGAAMRRQVYLRGVSAVMAFVDHKPLSKLYAAKEDPFKGLGIPSVSHQLAR